MEIKRTERGWAGHFICARDCGFRRNTLIEADEVRVVVSTVGNYQNEAVRKIIEELNPSKKNVLMMEVGVDRFYETMIFYAKKEGAYWDADVQRQITVDEKWCLGEDEIKRKDVDLLADAMHEKNVKNIIEQIRSGDLKG